MTPAEIKQARLAAGLTQKESAALVYVNVRTWQKWEGGEREIMRAVFELFKIKTGLLALNDTT